MQTSPVTIDKRHAQSWAIRAVGIAAITALLAVAAPLVWNAVMAGVGIGLIALMLLSAAIVFKALPFGLQTLENHLLALRKAEARRNPIEQLQNEMLRRAHRLKNFRKALVEVGGQIESIEDMLKESQRKDPSHVMERQQRALFRLKQFHSMNLNRLVQAQAALEEYRLTVARKESEWRIALAIQDTTEALNPHEAEDLMQGLMTDTALRSVQDRFNAVFAELDIQMRSESSPTHALLDGQDMDQLDRLEIPVVTVQEVRK